MSAYVTVTEADTYFAQHLYAAAWTEATNKEAALTTATRTIDRQLLRGRKADPSQDLAFPRYPDTAVPQAVKDATCEEALALLERSAERMKLQREGVRHASIGGMTEIYRDDAGRGLLSPEARELLRPWLAGAVPIC